MTALINDPRKGVGLESQQWFKEGGREEFERKEDRLVSKFAAGQDRRWSDHASGQRERI